MLIAGSREDRCTNLLNLNVLMKLPGSLYSRDSPKGSLHVKNQE